MHTPGFKSRCANPSSCINCSPLTTWEMISRVSLSGSLVCFIKYRWRSPNGQYSIAIQRQSESLYHPNDWTNHGTYFRLENLASASSSDLQICNTDAVWADVICLTARCSTWLPLLGLSSSSFSSHTTPLPPLPITRSFFHFSCLGTPGRS